ADGGRGVGGGGAELAGGGDELGGFAFEYLEVGGLVEGEVVAVVELEEPAGAHDLRCAADEQGGLGGGEGGAEAVGGGDEVVAESHGGLVAPEGVDGLAAAADVGLVEDVVVDEGGHVDHLADGGEGDMGVGEGGEGGVGGEAPGADEDGAEHLAAVAFDV